jgi:methylmalonyl-CoA carboxyltransferase large subunit
MVRVTATELAGMLEQLRAQMTEISQRLEALEKERPAGRTGKDGAPGRMPPAAAAPVPAAPGRAAITEEELIAISAAIGAYLGVRAHIRNIRLLSTNAWAQQGRVSIQASHRL